MIISGSLLHEVKKAIQYRDGKAPRVCSNCCYMDQKDRCRLLGDFGKFHVEPNDVCSKFCKE